MDSCGCKSLPAKRICFRFQSELNTVVGMHSGGGTVAVRGFPHLAAASTQWDKAKQNVS